MCTWWSLKPGQKSREWVPQELWNDKCMCRDVFLVWGQGDLHSVVCLGHSCAGMIKSVASMKSYSRRTEAKKIMLLLSTLLYE